MSGDQDGSRPTVLDAARQHEVEKITGTIASIAFTLADEVGEQWADDLLSAGYEGACQAALAYQLGSRTPFEGFAWRRIAGAMINFLRRQHGKLPPNRLAALEKAAAALDAAADYVAEVRDKGEDDAEEEAEGAAGAAAIGLLCKGTGTADPESLLLQEERCAHVRRAVSLLSERDRLLVTLRDFDGRTFKELAAHLGIHEDTARDRYHAAMRKLGAILRPILLGP
jgi:RNA polymerase sigma factor (sigma-70 family)